MLTYNPIRNPRLGIKTILVASWFLFFCFMPYLRAQSTSQVPVYPWQDLGSMVGSYPSGTSFLIMAGVHRMQSAVPKNYDTFTGQSGAILSGAQLLTSFNQSSTYWVARVQATAKTYDSSLCDASHPACDLPEDLFFNDVPLIRVLSRSQVGPGKWYLDYSTGEVYLGDNPAGHNVEISLLPYAFSGSATGVSISHLVIEKYASPRDAGAIHARNGTGPLGQHWTVAYNEIMLNHGMGLRICDYLWAHHNMIHDNGQMGMGGTGKFDVIQSNQIYSNNYAGYTYSYAGGSKFVRCSNLKIQYNNVHDNNGPGLWTDIDNNNVLIEHNATSHNVVAGIFVEISYNETVRYNYITNDGWNPRGTSLWWGAGILVNSSPGISIYGNIVKNCANGIGGIQTDRGSGAYGPYLIQNLSVHDNSIYQAAGTAEGIVKASAYDNSVYTSWNNHFQNDTYSLNFPAGNCFYWLANYHNLAWWDQYASLH